MIQFRNRRCGGGELGGLSPEQAFRLLHLSWESPESPLRFTIDLPLGELEASRILRRSRILLKAILERGGVQPTQAGNLPRAFVYEMMVAMGSPRPGSDRNVSGTRRYNEQSTDLFNLRTFLEFAGCIRRYRKKFIVARSIRPLLNPERAGELLRKMLNEVVSHGWETASSSVYPFLLTANSPAGGITARDARDLIMIVEAVAGFSREKGREIINMTESGWNDENGVVLRLESMMPADSDVFTGPVWPLEPGRAEGAGADPEGEYGQRTVSGCGSVC